MMNHDEQNERERNIQIHLMYCFLLYSPKQNFENVLEKLKASRQFQDCKRVPFEEEPPVEEPCRSIMLDIPYYLIKQELFQDEKSRNEIFDQLKDEELQLEDFGIRKIDSVAKLFLSGFGTFRITLDLECSKMGFLTHSLESISEQAAIIIGLIQKLRKSQELLKIFEAQITKIKETLGKDYYWLEKDRIPGAGSLERQMVSNGEIPWQIPYLLVCLKSKGFNYSHYKGKDFEGILLLSKNPTGNTSFLLQKEETKDEKDRTTSKLVDMFPSEAEFCYLGRDLALLVTDPEKVRRFDQEDMLYFLEILELLHLYCYTYIIANHILDGEIAHIAKALGDIRPQLPAKGRNLIEVMEKARNFTKSWFDEKVILTRFMEEPIIHRSVGKYARVYAQGVESFNLREFKKALVDKVGLLNRLYDDMMEEIRLEQYIERLQ